MVVFEPMQYGIDTKFQFEMRIGIDDYKFVFNTDVVGTTSNLKDDNQFDEEKLNDNSDKKVKIIRMTMRIITKTMMTMQTQIQIQSKMLLRQSLEMI